jgi:hypothetical protein
VSFVFWEEGIISTTSPHFLGYGLCAFYHSFPSTTLFKAATVVFFIKKQNLFWGIGIHLFSVLSFEKIVAVWFLILLSFSLICRRWELERRGDVCSERSLYRATNREFDAMAKERLH